MKAPPWILAASADLEEGETVTLTPTESRHLAGPLRRRRGDQVILVDGAGRMAEAKLNFVDRHEVEAQIGIVRRERPPQGSGVTLALAILDRNAMDLAVQKAVEIGIRCLQPVVTERCQAHRRSLDGRVDHWRSISLQAIKQCRRPWAMDILEPQTLDELISTAVSGKGVVADSQGGSLKQLSSRQGGHFLVGPEGGLSPAEMTLLDDRGWTRLRLGPHVLRSETAALVGSALLVLRNEEVQS